MLQLNLEHFIGRVIGRAKRKQIQLVPATIHEPRNIFGGKSAHHLPLLVLLSL